MHSGKFILAFREGETDPKAPLADGEEEEDIGDPVPVIFLFLLSRLCKRDKCETYLTEQCSSRFGLVWNCGYDHGGNGHPFV